MSTARDNPPPGSQGSVVVRQGEGITPIEYHLVKKLGDGTFGVVWKAIKKERGRPELGVALKILKATASSEEAEREIKSLEALKDLNHPLLLLTHCYWMDGDRLVIELELADGGSLKERLKVCKKAGMRGIPVGELLKYFREASWALDYLHTRQPQIFLHRDIKPANILLVKGKAKLADFGLLRQVAGDKSHTHTTGGTEPYMAPESIVGNTTSPRTDLFALAVSYVQLRQGTLPFRGDLSFAIMKKIVDDPPELAADVFGAAELAVLMKALEKVPANRYRTCGEFVTALIESVPASEAAFVSPDTIALRPTTLSSPEVETDAAASGTLKPLSGPRRTDYQIRIPDMPVPATAKPAPESDATVKYQATTATEAPADAPTTTYRSARRRKRPPSRMKLVAVLFVLLFLGAGAGAWYYLHTQHRSNIDDMITDKKYPEALERIATAKWLLPQSNTYIEDVQKYWWNDLGQKKGGNLKALQEQREDLEKFALAFPNQDGIAKRRAEIDKAIASFGTIPKKDPVEISNRVVQLFEKLLEAGDVAEASRLINEKRADLLAKDLVFVEGKLERKREVDKDLQSASQAIANAQFAEALKTLDSGKQPELNADKEKWSGLLAKAISGEHTRLIDAAEKLLKDLKKPELDLAREKLRAFRDKYSTVASVPPLARYTIAANSVAELAWTALRKPDLPGCRKYLDQLKKDYASDAKSKSTVRILTAFVDAHGAAGTPNREMAATKLIGALGAEKSVVASAAPRIWSALEKLEQKSFWTFEDVSALVDLVSADVPERSQTIASTLKRLVSAKESWCPKPDQWERCAELCERIHDDDKNIWIRCLHVEAWVQSRPDAAVPDAMLKTVDNSNLWYAGYVTALARHKVDAKAAANKLASVVENHEAKLMEQKERAAQALLIMRDGLDLLRKKGQREFSDASGARAAKKLLVPITVLETSDRQRLNDLVDLGLAASMAKEIDALHDAARRAAKLMAEPKLQAEVREENYYWFGKSYRLCDFGGEQTEHVYRHYDQALVVNKSGTSAWRKLSAEEGAEFAKRVSSNRQQRNASEKELEAAVRDAEKCQQYARELKHASPKEAATLQQAAMLNRDGFELEFQATRRLSSGRKDKANERYMKAVAPKCEEFHVPLVAFKLGQVVPMEYTAEDNEYLKKAVEEGRLAISIAENARKAAASNKERLAWWDAAHQDLCRNLYGSLAWYTKHRHIKIHNEDPSKPFDKTYIPRLQALLDYAKEARKAGPPSEKEEARITFRIGKLYYDLGASNGFAAPLHQKSLDELTKAVLKKVPFKEFVDVDRIVEGRNELQAMIYYNEKIIENEKKKLGMK